MKNYQRFVIENRDLELFQKFCVQKEFTFLDVKEGSFKLIYNALKANETNLCPTFIVHKSEGKLNVFLQKFSKKYPWLIILLCFSPSLGLIIPIESVFSVETPAWFTVCLLTFLSMVTYAFFLIFYLYQARKAHQQLIIIQKLIRKLKSSNARI